jgi:hypothetical protein
MKRLLFVLALAGAGLLLAGCNELADLQTASGPPRTRVFPAAPRATYAAAKAALQPMDYRFVRGGPAEGELEAISGIEPGDMGDGSHQVTLKAEFHPAANGGTEVDVWLTDIVDENPDDRTHPPTETALDNPALSEAFFDGIGQALAAPAK